MVPPKQKRARDGPKWGREFFFPTNPDLADILGRMDFDFENFYFSIFWKPLTADYVAAGGLFFQKGGPHIFGSPELVGTLPQAPFFYRKMVPRFLEALNLWVRCRRRLFFFRKMAPRFPDAAGAGAAGGAGRILRSQPDPSPNAPRDQIRRKDPCCDNTPPRLINIYGISTSSQGK